MFKNRDYFLLKPVAQLWWFQQLFIKVWYIKKSKVISDLNIKYLNSDKIKHAQLNSEQLCNDLTCHCWLLESSLALMRSVFVFLNLQEDDDIEEGDLPEHKRSPPPIDFSKMDASKPEELLKMSKKGRTLMVFATVSGDPTEKETEEVTGLWQGSLFNANFDIQRWIFDTFESHCFLVFLL